MIIRHAARARWTIVDNEVLERSDLNFRDKGLLVYLLSKPDGWEAKADHLANCGSDGRHAILQAMKALEAAGYVVRKKERQADGRLRTVTIVYESPEADPPKSENPLPVPPGEMPTTGVRFTDSGGSDPLVRTEGANTERDREAVAEAPAPFSDISKEVTNNFWQWVKERTEGHRPPEEWNVIRKIVKWALDDGYSRSEVGKALIAIHHARPRPITKQTLSAEMQGLRSSRSTESGAGTNDWVAAVEKEQARIDADRQKMEADQS